MKKLLKCYLTAKYVCFIVLYLIDFYNNNSDIMTFKKYCDDIIDEAVRVLGNALVSGVKLHYEEFEIIMYQAMTEKIGL